MTRPETAELPAGALAELRTALSERRRVLQLLHRDGGLTVPLAEGAALVIGREPPADVLVPEPSVSRRHARVTVTNGAVAIEDLGSRHGVRVNGVAHERATLAPGDEIALGAAVATVLELAATERTPGELEGHDQLRAALEEEIVRARCFGRGLALVHVRAASGAGLGRFCARLQQRLRQVDRLAPYGPGVAEVLLPEADADAALKLARDLAAGTPALLCGVAVFPDAGTSADSLLQSCRGALQQASADAPVQLAAAASRALEDAGDGPIATSPAMIELLDTLERLARSQIPVLLVGETGAGKEEAARLLHARGPRKDELLCSVNCGAIPATLVESTLFGHERGAFTGAAATQKGVFETAEGGTVLLDEVGELPLPAQAALLRVLESKRFTRVGATREQEVDVRVVAATHRDLAAMVAEGKFREDLLYRLNAVTVKVPPLRERRDEIPLLVERFLARANRENGGAVRGVAPAAMELLCRHAWPGNVRELRNAIERAVVLARGELVAVEDLPEAVRALAAPQAGPAPAEGDFKSRMQQYEAEVLLEALRVCGGNQTEAARHLQMSLRTFVHKLKQHGIKKEYAR